MIDKKKIIKLLLVIGFIAIIIAVFFNIRDTISRYESELKANPEIEVAFWVVNDTLKSPPQEGIFFSNLNPNVTIEKDLCSVSNFDVSGKRAETTIEYELKLTTTTNMPLKFDIKIDSGSDNVTSYSDVKEIVEIREEPNTGVFYKYITLRKEDGKYFEIPHSQNITDKFKIYISFDDSITNYDSPEFADLIESAKIELVAQQKIEQN